MTSIYCRKTDLADLLVQGEGTLFCCTGSAPFTDWIELVPATQLRELRAAVARFLSLGCIRQEDYLALASAFDKVDEP